MKLATSMEVGVAMRDACRAIAPVVVFIYALGYAFGSYIHQLNDDVTALFTGHIFITRVEYIKRLRARGLSIKAIAKKLTTTEYQVKKALR